MSVAKKAVRADDKLGYRAAKAGPVPCRASTSDTGQLDAITVRNMSRMAHSVSATGLGCAGSHRFGTSS